MQDRPEIRRLAILERWFELNLFCGANRRLIQSVPQSLHHFQDADLSGRGKDDFDQDLAFDFQLAAFISVNRPGLECDLRRDRFHYRFGDLGLGLRSGNDVGISKTTLPDCSARGRNPSRTVARCHAAAEARAGNYAARALGSARAVAIARARGHIEGSLLGNGDWTTVIIGSWDTVRIAKPAGLNFSRCGCHGWSR